MHAYGFFDVKLLHLRTIATQLCRQIFVGLFLEEFKILGSILLKVVLIYQNYFSFDISKLEFLEI